MKLGIFARTFVRPTLTEALDAVAAHGLTEVQLNLACCGLPTLPDVIPASLPREVRTGVDARNLSLAAMSATFNLIHPDPEHRRVHLHRLGLLAAAAADFGTPILSLCTGTRDPENMWHGHPDNGSESAWSDLLASVGIALRHAERHRVVLGVEPEVSNVVDSAVRARRLLDHFRSPWLRVVMDPANLFHAGELPSMTRVLTEAFALLGPDIVLAHAKDLSRDGEAGHDAAGTGVLDYDLYLRLLRERGFSGALVLHGLAENQVASSIEFLRSRIKGPAALGQPRAR